jgi:hypothetical protein
MLKRKACIRIRIEVELVPKHLILISYLYNKKHRIHLRKFRGRVPSKKSRTKTSVRNPGVQKILKFYCYN